MKSLKPFRENKSEEFWQELLQHYNSSDNKAKAFPTDEFPFSSTSAAKLLEERNMITRRKRSQKAVSEYTETQNRDFVIRQIPEEKLVIRSLQFYSSTLERLKGFESNYKQYRSRDIVNQLLTEAMEMHGF